MDEVHTIILGNISNKNVPRLDVLRSLIKETKILCLYILGHDILFIRDITPKVKMSYMVKKGGTTSLPLASFDLLYCYIKSFFISSNPSI